MIKIWLWGHLTWYVTWFACPHLGDKMFLFPHNFWVEFIGFIGKGGLIWKVVANYLKHLKHIWYKSALMSLQEVGGFKIKKVQSYNQINLS